MFSSQLPISLVSSTENLSVRTAILEVRHTSTLVDRLAKLGISPSESLVQASQNRSEKEKTLTVYSDNGAFFQVLCFFPHEGTRIDDRAEMCRQHKNDILYIPDGEVEEAFEVFALATYEFTRYKTKKTENKKYFFVENTSDIYSKLETKIPLYASILDARDMVNMSPYDLNPESLVSLIREKKWKHFDVQIFGESDLRDMGCQLIRAVGQ